jgi:hypothetical protein
MFYKKSTIKTVDGNKIILFDDTLSSDDQRMKFNVIYQEYINSSITYNVNYEPESDSITVESVWANKSIYEEALVRCKSKQLELFDKSFQQYYENNDIFVLDVETIDDFKQK